MLDRMNQTSVDNEYLQTLENAKEALHDLMQKCKSDDDDNMEFIIELTCFDRDKYLDVLTDALNKAL